MSCITNELIQKYIDGETDLEEYVSVKNHLACCELCNNKFVEQQNRAIDIKNNLNLLIEDNIVIPKIVLPLQVNRRRLVLKRRLIYALSAACILLFLVLILPTNRGLNQNEITMIQSVDEDYDANLPVTQQKLKIQVVDPSGRVSEFYID